MKDINWDFLKEFAKLHNEVAFKVKSQDDFNKFVSDNKEKFDNPEYLQVFAENIVLFKEDFFKANFDMCNFFYDLLQENTEWREYSFGLRTSIRLGTFEDEFKKYLTKAEIEHGEKVSGNL